MRIVKRLFAAMLSTALVFTNTVSSFADEAEAPLPDETVQVEETVVEQAPEEQDPVVSDVEISQEDTETVTVQESEQTENNNQFNQVPITGTNSQNGVTVNVSAPVNSFPEGTNVVIVPVDSQQSGLYVQDVAPYGSAIGFDISFVNGSAQVQPANGQAVSLEFVIESDSAFTKYPSSTIDLYHIYNGAVELLSAMNSYTEGSTTIIRVSAVSFSPFILVENGEITVEESDEQEASKAVQNNVITGFDLYTQNGSTPIGTTTIAQWQIMRLTAQFALPNGEVHAGDTTTLTLPNELRFSQVANFNITDSEGNVVAHAVIDGNNKTITLTYTEYPETHSDVTGSFFFYVQMDRTVVLQPTTVVLEMDVNGNVVPSGPYTFEGVPDPTPFAGDKSGWQKASDDQRR